jgi:hypothetical protein
MIDTFEHVVDDPLAYHRLHRYFTLNPTGRIYAMSMTSNIPDDLKDQVQVEQVDGKTVWKFEDRDVYVRELGKNSTVIYSNMEFDFDRKLVVGPFVIMVITGREQREAILGMVTAPLAPTVYDKTPINGPQGWFYRCPPVGERIPPLTVESRGRDVRLYQQDMADGTATTLINEGKEDSLTKAMAIVCAHSHGTNLPHIARKGTAERAMEIAKSKTNTKVSWRVWLITLLYMGLFNLSGYFDIIPKWLEWYFATVRIQGSYIPGMMHLAYRALFIVAYVRRIGHWLINFLLQDQLNLMSHGVSYRCCMHPEDLAQRYAGRLDYSLQKNLKFCSTRKHATVERILHRCHTLYTNVPCIIPKSCEECTAVAWGVRHCRDNQPISDEIMADLQIYMREIFMPRWFPAVAHKIIDAPFIEAWLQEKKLSKQRLYEQAFERVCNMGGYVADTWKMLNCFQKIEKTMVESIFLGKAYRVIQFRPQLMKVYGPIIEAIMEVVKVLPWCVKANLPPDRKRKLRAIFKARHNIYKNDIEAFDASVQKVMMMFIMQEMVIPLLWVVADLFTVEDPLFNGAAKIFTQKEDEDSELMRHIYAIYTISGSLFSGDAWTAFMGESIQKLMLSYNTWRLMGRPKQPPEDLGLVDVNDGDDQVFGLIETYNGEDLIPLYKDFQTVCKLERSPSNDIVEFCSGFVFSDGSYMRNPVKVLNTIGYTCRKLTLLQQQQHRGAVACGLLYENEQVPIITAIAINMAILSSGFTPEMHDGSGFYNLDHFILNNGVKQFFAQMTSKAWSYNLDVDPRKRNALCAAIPALTPEVQILMERSILQKTNTHDPIWVPNELFSTDIGDLLINKKRHRLVMR